MWTLKIVYDLKITKFRGNYNIYYILLYTRIIVNKVQCQEIYMLIS